MKKLISSILLCLALSACHMVPVAAQQFPTVPGQSLIGRLGIPGDSGPSQAIPMTSLQAALNANVNTIAALRNLHAGASNSANVLGYYVAGDGGGGTFTWNAASVTADNGGSIIAVAGVTTGRWIRQTVVQNEYTPEMFGAKTDGTNAGTAIANLTAYLGGLTGGGTMRLSCGKTYTISTLQGSYALIWAYANVNIVGCGPNSVIKMANGVNTSSSFFARGIGNNTTDVSNVRYAAFTIDMNGANNSCSATCYAFNGSIQIAISGDNITVDGMKFINNPGSNDIVIGAGSGVTFTNITIANNVHEHNGDIVNAASADYSGDFLIASNVTHVGNIYSDGPRTNGSAYEIHGVNVVSSNNVVTDHFNCAIISNETFSAATNDINIGNSTCKNVKSGIQIASRPAATNTNINVHDLTIEYLSGSAGMAIDACSVVDVATGANLNLSISHVLTMSDVSGNLGNDAAAMCIGQWQTVLIANNQTNFSQGPGIYFSAIANGARIKVVGNQINNPGRTSNAAMQIGIYMPATALTTLAGLSIQNNDINGTVVNGVKGSENSSAGYIIGNLCSGCTGTATSWTGTGAQVFLLPGASGTLAGVDIAQTFTANQQFNDQNFLLKGSTSGTLNLRAAAIAGTSVVRFPSGSTDFTATGGASQVVKQAGAGAALTVGQLAYSDISGTHNTYSQIAFSAGNLNPLLQASTWYFTTGPAATTENVVAIPMSQAGTIDKLYCSSNAAPGGAAQTFTLTARKNASDQTLTCTMTTGGASTCNDTTHSFSVAAADLVDMKLVTSATSGTASGMSCGMRLTTASP